MHPVLGPPTARQGSVNWNKFSGKSSKLSETGAPVLWGEAETWSSSAWGRDDFGVT